jgi:hypothetical protein
LINMPPTRVIPDATTLRRLVSEGHTHQDIADMVRETTGQPVTRGAVSSAISRAGLSTPGKRYERTLPWRVKIEHSKHYAARMLRLLGRRLEGEPLHEADESRLDSWLARLDAENAVVAYIPETEDGFHYIDPPAGWDHEVPIVPEVINLRDIGTRVTW